MNRVLIAAVGCSDWNEARAHARRDEVAATWSASDFPLPFIPFISRKKGEKKETRLWAAKSCDFAAKILDQTAKRGLSCERQVTDSAPGVVVIPSQHDEVLFHGMGEEPAGPVIAKHAKLTGLWTGSVVHREVVNGFWHDVCGGMWLGLNGVNEHVFHFHITTKWGELVVFLLFHVKVFENQTRQVQSPCHHGRECYTSINPSIKQSIIQSINHSINQSFNRAINQSINQAINQSINQSFNQANKQSIHQSIDQSINQSFNQSIHQSIDQSIRQSTDFHSKMSFLFGFEIFPGFYSFLHVSWYISEVWLDGMSEGVVGMRELSAWPRVLVYRSLSASSKDWQWTCVVRFFITSETLSVNEMFIPIGKKITNGRIRKLEAKHTHIACSFYSEPFILPQNQARTETKRTIIWREKKTVGT